MSIEVARLLGYLLPPWAHCFQRTLRYFRDAGPRTIASTGSSSRGLYLFYRELSDCHPPETRKPRAPLMGFRPSSRQSWVESTNNELPKARLTFRPQRFSRSRRLTPPHTLWACFIPQPRPGFTLQGFFPLPSQPAFRRAVPSCRYRDSPADRWPCQRQILSPAFRALIRVAIRCKN